MERFVIIWEKLRGGRAEWVGVWLPYEWPRLKRFEINAVLNIMVYRSRYCRRGGESMIYQEVCENWDSVLWCCLTFGAR